MSRAKSVVKLFGTVVFLSALTLSGASCTVFDELEPPQRPERVGEEDVRDDARRADDGSGGQPDAVARPDGDGADGVGIPEIDIVPDSSAQPSGDGLEIVPNGAQLQVGASMLFEAVRPAGDHLQGEGTHVLWSSADELVASVDAGGRVMAHAVGTTEISAQAGTAAASVTVVVVAPIERLEIEPQAVTLEVTQTVDLVVHAIDITGEVHTDLPIDWVSADSEVATVDALGRVRGMTQGAARIVASLDGLQAEALVTVEAPVRAVSVSPDPASVGVGSTGQMKVQLTDLAGNLLHGRDVIWTSSDTPIATIDDEGVVSGHRGGQATITASSEGVSASAQLLVADPVASVEILPAALTVDIMQIKQLSAVARDAAGNVLDGRLVTWRSQDPTIAMVDVDGRVTGINPGDAEITASAEGQFASIRVTVQNSVASLSVSPPSVTLEVTDQKQLTATARNLRGDVVAGARVTWRSSDTAIVKVDAAGKITALTGGSATISATIGDERVDIPVTVQNPVRSVRFGLFNPTLEITDSLQLRVTLKDKGGNTVDGPVEWSSDERRVASVTGDGRVTGAGAGTTTIQAKSNGVVARATVEVITPARSLTIFPASLNLEVGESRELTATVRDKGGNTLSGYVIDWATSKAEVAGVVSDVRMSADVLGVGLGTATIHAKIQDPISGEFSASAPVTVKKAAVAGVSLTPASVTLTVGESRTVLAMPRDARGNPLPDRVVAWTNPNIQIVGLGLTIDGHSLTIDAKKRGSVTLTATSEGITQTMNVTVVRPLIFEPELPELLE